MLSLVLLLTLISFTLAKYKAILVAGSNGWENYRHQADTFHAYTELIQNNISVNDIILFAYNDIAYNPLNPTPGLILNRPNGPNVFPGNASITYSGNDVTPEKFLSTLKNLSDPNLDLLIFFSDHGGPGLLCFPNEYLYADQLQAAILAMEYKSLFFVVEACEAGSMFDGWFPVKTSALVLSATNPFESSWACYYDPQLDTYLGDYFSVNTLQFLDPADTYIETLELLSRVVQDQTTTSPVSLYGDMRLLNKHIYMYWGFKHGGVQDTDDIVRKILTDSRDVPYEIGLRTQHDRRFDYIRQQDKVERLLYDKLRSALRRQSNIAFDTYKSPVNVKCIRACVTILSERRIKLSGYSNLFIKTIASVCDHTSDIQAIKLMISISKNV